QAQAGGAGAVPAAWGLPVAGQVLLVVGGQLAGVVLLPPHPQLGDVWHPPPAAPSRPRGASNAPVVHCCPRNELRAERRANGDASSVMTRAASGNSGLVGGRGGGRGGGGG